MSALASRAIGAMILLIAGLLVVAGTASGAERRVSVTALSGAGTHDVSYDQLNLQTGPVLYFSQRFDWQLAPGAPRAVLRLPDRGRRRSRVPIRVHIVSSGGSNSYPYTCQAETTYQSRALVEAKQRRGGWRISLTPAPHLRPGPPTCSDATAQATFQWPTGGDWFAATMPVKRSLSFKQARGATLSYARRPATSDCTEVPGVTTPCTERLSWTGTLKLARKRSSRTASEAVPHKT